jgi:NitT/TauT family transport system ATP-binding protein
MHVASEAPATSTTAISIRNVDKVFDAVSPPVEALRDVSLEIGSGEVTVLIGPSGCGKSTLLNMIAGLDHPTGGSVHSTHEGRGATGVMFQKSSLQPWRTALQNVLLPAELLAMDRRTAPTRAAELLELVGLAKFKDRYPDELSGGMQQRVALARVLLPDPDVILLDEPFGALDEMTRESLDIEMCRIVERTHKTVVMVTHSIYEAGLVADKIAVLSAHPGQLAGVVEVGLPRPRDIEMSGSDDFAELVARVRALLRSEEQAVAG